MTGKRKISWLCRQREMVIPACTECGCRFRNDNRFAGLHFSCQAVPPAVIPAVHVIIIEMAPARIVFLVTRHGYRPCGVIAVDDIDSMGEFPQPSVGVPLYIPHFIANTPYDH